MTTRQPGSSRADGAVLGSAAFGDGSSAVRDGRPPSDVPRIGVRGVLLASWRDLQWRTRRFLLGALATGLILGLALMVSGIANSFSVEIDDTVGSLGAATWLVPDGSPGPFTASRPFPVGDVAAIAKLPGMGTAAPLLVGLGAADPAPAEPGTSPTGAHGFASDKDVNLLGVLPGRLGSPVVVDGRGLSGPGQVVADTSLGAPLGRTIRIDGEPFRVVGLVHGVTYFAGEPVVFMDIHSLDRLVAGAPVASAVLVRGATATVVPGFTSLDVAQVRADLNRPVAQAEQTLKLIQVLLWLVAAGIIAAIAYLSALERRGDFAVLKAVGTPSSSLFLGLVLQALLLACVAAAVGFAVEVAVSPASAMAVRVSGTDYAALPIVAVLVGLAAGILPARRAASVDPALAFGGGR